MSPIARACSILASLVAVLGLLWVVPQEVDAQGGGKIIQTRITQGRKKVKKPKEEVWIGRIERNRDAFLGYIDEVRSVMRIAGGTVMVVHQDKGVVLARSFGEDDAGNPLVPETPFLIGALTRSLTAAAVVQLSEAGKLDLDASIEVYLKGLRFDQRPSKPITVRHLLHHTSGLSDARDVDVWLGEEKELPALPVREPAGTRQLPARLNYVLLGNIIESVSGQSYAAYLQEHILTPLEMTNTTASATEVPPSLAPGRQYLYGFHLGCTEPQYNEMSIPSDFVYASAADMGRWLQATLRQGGEESQDKGSTTGKQDGAKSRGKRKRKKRGAANPKNKKSKKKSGAKSPSKEEPTAHKPILSPEGWKALGEVWQGGDQGQAMGWERVQHGKNIWWEQTGSTGCYSASMALIPEQKLGIVVLTNVNSVGAMGPKALRTGFVELMLERTAQVFAFVEIVIRVVAGLLLLFGLFDLPRQILIWRRLGSPRSVSWTAGRVVKLVLGLATSCGLFVAGVWWLGLDIPLLLRTQPDLTLALWLAFPMLSVRMIVNAINRAHKEEAELAV